MVGGMVGGMVGCTVAPNVVAQERREAASYHKDLVAQNFVA